MNAVETVRQRNARLRADVRHAAEDLDKATAAHDEAHDAAVDVEQAEALTDAGLERRAAMWEAVYELEERMRGAQTDLQLAESAYRLRDVPAETQALVAANID